MAVDTPHFDFPLRFVGGQAAVLEQDSLRDVLVCVEIILRYPRGYRPELPAFGRPDNLEFAKGDLDLDAIAAQLAEFEPRAQTLIEEERDAFDSALRTVLLGVSAGE